VNGEPTTRKVITASDVLWARVTAFQLAETARLQKMISQADIIRRALTAGMDALERDSDLDAT
jgi:hypothetical protein